MKEVRNSLINKNNLNNNMNESKNNNETPHDGKLLLAKKCYISAVIKSACGHCIYYLTCNSESRDKQICDNYDNEA